MQGVEPKAVHKQAEERGLVGEELLQNRYFVAFLRSNVHQINGDSQVPVMGKVKGAGEMLFRLP